MGDRILLVITLFGLSGNLLLIFILCLLRDILNTLKDIDDNVAEVDATIEKVSR